MDITEFANQTIFWNIGERSKNTNMDSNMCIFAHCNNQEKPHHCSTFQPGKSFLYLLRRNYIESSEKA